MVGFVKHFNAGGYLYGTRLYCVFGVTLHPVETRHALSLLHHVDAAEQVGDQRVAAFGNIALAQIVQARADMNARQTMMISSGAVVSDTRPAFVTR